jgi:hypothetical protein
MSVRVRMGVLVVERTAQLLQSPLEASVGILDQLGGGYNVVLRRTGPLGPLTELRGVLAVVRDPVGQKHS